MATDIFFKISCNVNLTLVLNNLLVSSIWNYNELMINEYQREVLDYFTV